MNFRRKKLFSFVLSFLLIIGIFNIPAQAEEETVHLTILGTTDIHANIYNWSYEDGEEVEDLGLTKVYSVIKAVREENPNTLLLDNGDTIQGTILSDDLYNIKLDVPHPVIDVMNYMAAAMRGDIARAADMSFDCLMCGLCAARCPAETVQYNIAILARRLYARHIAPQAKHLASRVREILDEAFEQALDEMTALTRPELEGLYNERDIEPE